MRIYPAIKAHMGDWNYYIVRMKMREIAQEVKFAHDIHADKTLSDAVQRILKERRVKKDIVGYLAQRPDRFFSSIVVAAMDGEPVWHPVEMDEEVVPKIFSSTASLRDSFGVLSFGDEPKYYALDGQHRVAAIKLLVTGEAEVDAPPGFENDLLSVIVVLREEHDVAASEWMRRYRRLFSSLNRYAQKTDRDTDIIMDEDDLFAILTRRLITDHEFFQAPGRERDSFKVQTEGKNLKKNAPQFTTLQTLYAMNESLLRTRDRNARGWFSNGEDLDIKIRPEEDFIEECYEELAAYWDAILCALPVLRKTPIDMRQHDQDESDDKYQDLLVFHPIGQELFAGLVRSLLDDAFPESGCGAVTEMTEALSRLKRIPWEMHEAPWRHLLLVMPRGLESWRMRSDDRKAALFVAHLLLRWMTGLDPLNREEIAELRQQWVSLLYPAPSRQETAEMWSAVKEARAEIVGTHDGTGGG